MNKQTIDKEYATKFMKEVDFLINNGIRYTYVKRDEFGERVYKFAKTKELFEVLTQFYK